MFNNGKGKKESAAQKSSPSSAAGGHSLNSIVKGTEIEGTVKANSDIRVDGHIQGNLFCEAKVIIGPTGNVNGEIRCANAVVEGKFEGKITVKELLNIRETAKVQGEITIGKLIVQPGGVIDGNITMSSSKSGGGSIAGSANKQQQSNKGSKVAG